MQNFCGYPGRAGVGSPSGLPLPADAGEPLSVPVFRNTALLTGSQLALWHRLAHRGWPQRPTAQRPRSVCLTVCSVTVECASDCSMCVTHCSMAFLQSHLPRWLLGLLASLVPTPRPPHPGYSQRVPVALHVEQLSFTPCPVEGLGDGALQAILPEIVADGTALGCGRP